MDITMAEGLIPINLHQKVIMTELGFYLHVAFITSDHARHSLLQSGNIVM